MAQLILVRHGQSLWNALNKFTGWVDVPLSERGRAEATITSGRLHQRFLSAQWLSAQCLLYE
jgi:2,3-bisphosphoglycerate-dependent phosphoglycerate mutase